MTLLIEGKAECIDEAPPDSQIEDELKELITSGHSLSMVMGLFIPFLTSIGCALPVKCSMPVGNMH